MSFFALLRAIRLRLAFSGAGASGAGSACAGCSAAIASSKARLASRTGEPCGTMSSIGSPVISLVMRACANASTTSGPKSICSCSTGSAPRGAASTGSGSPAIAPSGTSVDSGNWIGPSPWRSLPNAAAVSAVRGTTPPVVSSACAASDGPTAAFSAGVAVCGNIGVRPRTVLSGACIGPPPSGTTTLAGPGDCACGGWRRPACCKRCSTAAIPLPLDACNSHSLSILAARTCWAFSGVSSPGATSRSRTLAIASGVCANSAARLLA